MSPKEIAEMIIKKDLALDNVHSNYIIIARAYLELEEKHEYVHKKLLDDIEYQKKEITKLKKSREVLRKACEFYGDKIIGHAPNGKIEMLEHGEIAIKALKADSEIMEGK